jgi:SagB-type dehydrogenase family enzyme
VRGGQQLERSAELRASAARSVKRHPAHPFLPLPPPALGGALLADALARRRSRRAYADAPLSEAELATVLACAYGPTHLPEGTAQAFRTVPSGGALYPLELYVACHRVAPLDAALYHYDPLRHGLELLRPLVPSETAGVTPYDELVAPSAAVIVVTGVFWRARFKYGARAYRFTLIEAGHVGQNIALAAAALDLATVPVGGFFDRRADDLLGVDGLAEASLYLFPLGRPCDG